MPEFSKLPKFFFNQGEAAEILCMDEKVLCRLGALEGNEIFRPQKRHNGISRPVYSNVQIVAMKKCLQGMPPNDAYDSFKQAEANEENWLRQEWMQIQENRDDHN